MAGLMRLPNGNYVDPTKVVAVYVDQNDDTVMVLLDVGEQHGVQVLAYDWRRTPEPQPRTQPKVDEANTDAVYQIVHDVTDLNG